MIVRKAVSTDVPEMTDLLNTIIRIGGTTAHEVEMSEAKIEDYYVSGPSLLCSHVAVVAGDVVGFQVLGIYPSLPQGWGEIGTFVRPGTQRGGIGVALFAATVNWARDNDIRTIEAVIRADNAPGLGYYTRRGFVDFALDPNYALKDGRIVGRVSKRFDLDA